MILYKVLNDNLSCSGGTFDWTEYLPTSDGPGKWTPNIKDIWPCSKGYHGTYAYSIIRYLDGNQLFEVEPGHNINTTSDKFVTSRMRLISKVELYNEKTLRSFALWCVSLAESKIVDKRAQLAYEIANRWIADGKASDNEVSKGRYLTDQVYEEYRYMDFPYYWGLRALFETDPVKAAHEVLAPTTNYLRKKNHIEVNEAVHMMGHRFSTMLNLEDENMLYTGKWNI